MSPEQARDRFSEALDGELDAEAKAAFEAALAADAALKQEYDEFVETFRMVGSLGGEEEPAPDLLSGVQERLRKRSKGRYYRDRFSQRAGPSAWALPLLLAMVSVLVLALAWYALHSTVVLEAEAARTESAP
ncbi:MAG: hypothetical protein M5U28_52235 [Sandaracinaceae bacterium]|nr:hypothetical protein [Sandaracinaceae bacterium]